MKKAAFTLLEIMIVIFLIGLISAAIGFNMKGSLDEGRAFKTRQAAAQISDILNLQIAQSGQAPEVVASNPKKYLELSGLVSKPDKLLQDGWGKPFEIKSNGERIIIHSKELKKYNQRKGNIKGKLEESGDEMEDHAEEQ